MITVLNDMRKFLAALSGAVGVAVSSGLLSGGAERWVTTIIAVVTAFVVYFIPNGSATPYTGPRRS